MRVKYIKGKQQPIQLSPEVHLKAKIYAVNNGKSIKKFVEELIIKQLKEK